MREEVKQEVKQEEVKREPAPTAPAALPSAATTSLTDLRNAAEAAWALHERLGTEEDALLEKVKRFSQARERRGTPKPPPVHAAALPSTLTDCQPTGQPR